MTIFNETMTKCHCINCMVSGRCYFHEDEYMDNEIELKGNNQNTFHCQFQSAFEKLLEKNELSWTHDLGHLIVIDEIDFRCSSDVNAHFSNCAHGNWVVFKFGKKLWSASSIQNPEIQKYKNLIKDLYQFDDMKYH